MSQQRQSMEANVLGSRPPARLVSRRGTTVLFLMIQVAVVTVAIVNWPIAQVPTNSAGGWPGTRGGGSAAAHVAAGSAGELADLRDGELRDTGIRLARSRPLIVPALYNDPELVSDEELAAVMGRLEPRFTAPTPNYVEHALRLWGAEVRFETDAILSGRQMVDYLVDDARYRAIRGGDQPPLLRWQRAGIGVHFGRGSGGSVHHDHWLACLSEAGVSRDHPLAAHASARTATFGDAIRTALLDFSFDADEAEWSVLAFALWLPPTRHWYTAEGRLVTFDMLVDRLIRAHPRLGSCGGTHRVYTLAVLLRLDSEHRLLSTGARDKVRRFLLATRDRISASQFPDGSWPSNWSAGAEAARRPIHEPPYKRVIATGHHLEWLAMASPEFHPDRAVIERAARWCVETTLARSDQEIAKHYTYYSHVGSALARWRGAGGRGALPFHKGSSR